MSSLRRLAKMLLEPANHRGHHDLIVFRVEDVCCALDHQQLARQFLNLRSRLKVSAMFDGNQLILIAMNEQRGASSAETCSSGEHAGASAGSNVSGGLSPG